MRSTAARNTALLVATALLAPLFAAAEGPTPPTATPAAPTAADATPLAGKVPLVERLLGASTCAGLPTGLCIAPRAEAPRPLEWGLTAEEFTRRAAGGLTIRPFEAYWRRYVGQAADGRLAALRAQLIGELAPFAEAGSAAKDPLADLLEVWAWEETNPTTGEDRRTFAVFARLESEGPPRLVAAYASNFRNGKLDFEVLQQLVDKALQPLVAGARMAHVPIARRYVLDEPTEYGVVILELRSKNDAPPSGLLVVKAAVSVQHLRQLHEFALERCFAEWLKSQLATTGLPTVEELAGYRVASARKRLQLDPAGVMNELAPLLAFDFDQAEVIQAIEEARATIRQRDEAKLGATLLRELGKGGAVAIVPSAKGLLAVGVSSLEKRVLVPGPVAWAQVDVHAGVIWFGRSNKVSSDVLLIDLQDLDVRPEVVVSGLPPNESVAIQHGEDYRSFDAPGTMNTILEFLPDRVKVVANGGGSEEFDPGSTADHAKAVARARVSAQRLAALAVRAAAAKPAKADPLPPRHVVKLDKKVCDVAENEACGGADELPGTPLWVVTTYAACGDLCSFDFQLYDPAKSEFFDPFKPKIRSKRPLPKAASLQGARVSLDGSALLIGGRLLRLADGATAGDKGLGGGFLGGDRVVVRY